MDVRYYIGVDIFLKPVFFLILPTTIGMDLLPITLLTARVEVRVGDLTIGRGSN